jgi:hypothetical protein
MSLERQRESRVREVSAGRAAWPRGFTGDSSRGKAQNESQFLIVRLRFKRELPSIQINPNHFTRRRKWQIFANAY